MKKALGKLGQLGRIVLSISGYVPEHATVLRTVVMAFTFFFSLHLVNSPEPDSLFPVFFYIASAVAYVGFLYLVLPQNGLRRWFIKTFGGEQGGYLAYEAVLSFLFFINGTGIGYISVAFENTLPLPLDEEVIRPVAVLLFVAGWVIKIWAAKVVGTDIYYWKDMFYGRQISAFVAEGPYRFINNPMYGLGQLQTYATALWYLSLPGLIAAFVNQLLVFSFYHFQEKKFIERVYLKNLSTSTEGRLPVTNFSS